MWPYSLTDQELRCLSDTDFLRTKAKVYQKTDQLLSATQQQLRSYMERNPPRFPSGVLSRGGKISRGENYRGLPYHVLDFPRKFTQDDIFALRTMVWWGHHISQTWHASGQSLTVYRSVIAQQLTMLQEWDWQVCVGHDPWQYHREADYYQPARNWNKSTWESWVRDRAFIKLSAFSSLREWEQLPENTVIFMDRIVRLLRL